MTVTIDHNPACGTSRNMLAMIRASGEEPEVVEYLTNPPSRERLVELIARAGLTVREAGLAEGFVEGDRSDLGDELSGSSDEPNISYRSSLSRLPRGAAVVESATVRSDFADGFKSDSPSDSP